MFKEIFEKVFMSEEFSKTVKEVNNIVKDTKNQVKGGFGEFRLDFILSRLNENYITVSDIILPGSNKTTQIDSIVISTYGIFIIECKNFSGYIYGNDKDKVWTQIIGQTKNTFYNPIRQNYAHIKAIENVIGNKYNIYSIVVFGEKATLRNITINEKNTKVINESEILKTISEYKDVTINKDEIKVIRDKIFECMKSTNQNTKQHISNLKNITEEDKCPRCHKGNLVKRKGKYGEFWSCSEYPKCKYTRK